MPPLVWKREGHAALSPVPRCNTKSLWILLIGQHLVNTDTAFVNVLTRGDLSSIQWIESPLKFFESVDHPQRQLCRVHYASLNFRDIMIATGKLPPDAIPGTTRKDGSCEFAMHCNLRPLNVATVVLGQRWTWIGSIHVLR